MKEERSSFNIEEAQTLFGPPKPLPISRQSSGGLSASQALLSTFAAPASFNSKKSPRYGSFPMQRNSTLSVKSNSPIRPWEDEHANLEDESMRQMALEFNLGVLFGASLSIFVNMCMGREHVTSFGTFGAFLCGIVMTISRYVIISAERERAQYEYEIERRHLNEFPNEERMELRHDLLKKGLSEGTVETILEDLSQKKHIQAQLHTLMHLGIDPASEKSKCIYRQCCITAFSVPFGAIFSMFPFFFITDGFRASLGCIFLLSMLSLACGAMLSLKASRSASYLALRQMLLTVGAAIFLYGISWIVGGTVWSFEFNAFAANVAEI